MIYGDNPYKNDNNKYPYIDAIVQSCNLYVYSGNNPITYLDICGNCYFDSQGNWCHDNWEYIDIQDNAYGSAREYEDVKSFFGTNIKGPNCYEYALGLNGKHSPGDFSGYTTSYSDINTFVEAVIADVCELGGHCRQLSDIDDIVFVNEYRIAMRIGTEPYDDVDGFLLYDYHFMVQNSDGTWSEKHGTGGNSIQHKEGETPETLPWTKEGEVYYDSEIIYFAVSL